MAWPALYFYLRLGRRTRLLVVAGNEVLVTKSWFGPDEWSTPGGGKRRYETPINGARRELFEETGIRVEPNELIPLGDKVFNLHGIKIKSDCFMVKLEKPLSLKKHSLELSEVKWVSWKQLQKEKVSDDLDQLLETWLEAKWC